ncbi:phosphotransferase enzyme family protein [Oleiagrimonas soli]|uniref:Aminoglycoside phosphotransferase n=1 Tax=Oleiagrimonas soli TaxID=1543381 RepID=A0A099CVK1_9GAMM|nr:phosphotransferase [Oleiagrimonas soli]KGI77973.1 aminoglycoside phosphotransferase [Oleiagrimonas soli]MBB6183650.1 Ser/Thr protein kinase RdoA (MazF antagonist) [Oleiagrimonas soli]
MSHRVHGLADDDVAPDWPALTHEEIAQVLAAFGFTATDAATWRSPRPLSAAALASTTDGVVFVKRHHRNVRSPESLREEHRFIAHLRAHDMPIPRVFEDRAGDTAHASDGWVYEVHARARGADLYREAISWSPLRRLDHARAAGAMLARLHRAAEHYRAAQRSTHILVARDDLLRADDPIATLERQLDERPGLAAYLDPRPWREDFARWILPRHARLQPLLRDRPRAWAHNDWHASNLCWSDDGRVAEVVDFGLCSPTGALFDLATAIERNAIAWLELARGADAVFVDSARALIDGYAAIAPLTDDDRRALAELLPLVHVEFALSEVEYFQAVTGSTANADVAYDTFLLGHTRWFDSAHAQPLLDAIRRGA